MTIGVLTLVLTACGGGGGSSSSGSGDGTAPPSNNPPSVAAGADQNVNEQATVSLTASASDSDGSIASWQWSQTAGETVTISGADSETATFAAPIVLLQQGAQTLTFEVKVTDDDGATATDSVNITVTPVNDAPTANAGDDQQVDEGVLVTLSGSASDNDGTVGSVIWQQVSGQTVTIENANSLNATFTAINSETAVIYTFELHVSDNEGETVSDTVSIESRPTITGLAVDDVLAGATVRLLNASDNSLIVETQTDDSGRYTISGRQSLPERYVFSVTGGQLNGQPFTGTLNSVCRRSERLSCNTTPLSTLVKRYADRKGELQSGDKDQWLETLSTKLGFDLTTEPFVNEDQSQVPLDTIRQFLQNGEQVEQWVEATLDYVENDEPSSQVDEWFPTANLLPVADAGSDQSVDEQSLVTLSGSATDGDGTIAAFAWTQLSGTSVTLVAADTASASFTAPTLLAAETLQFQLSVTDNEGGTASDTVKVTVNPVNANPVISAGLDQSVDEQSSVTLSANASDSDGTIESYLWTQTAGTAVMLSDAISGSAAFTAPTLTQAETLSFTVLVTDNEGGQASDSVSVTVNPVNAAPTVDAGNNQSVAEQVTVTLSATASDSDGSIAGYQWTQISGTGVSLSSATSATTTFTSPDVSQTETLVFQVTVTDNEGASTSDSLNVIVNVGNAVPVANAGADLSVNEQTTVTLAGTGTDSDGSIVAYLWAQTSGESVMLSDAATASATFTAPALTQTATLVFSLTVTDNEGATSSDSVNVLVNPVNTVPVANAGDDQSVSAGNTVLLSGSKSSDSDGDTLTYSWKLDTLPSGSSAALSSTSTVETSFVADVKGVYIASLVVNDGTENSAADTVSITANAVNSSPTGAVAISGITEVGEMLTASNTLADANGLGSFSYQWRRSKDSVTTNIDNATATTYTIETEDIGYTLSMNISYTDGDGFAESVNSGETTVVTEVTSAGKPNILLIIADDQGLDASAQYNLSSDLPSTPNIDAMAAAGLVFENAWATPACTTTRGTLITGKHGVNSGITTVPYKMDTSTETIQRYIKSLSDSADYQTAVIGKWHLGGGNPDLSHPTDSGVDYYAGTIAGTIDDYYSWDLVENGQSSTVTEYHTTKITDLAINWLDTQNGSNTPWFLWLAYVAPHSPFHLPPADLHNRSDLTGEADHIDENPRDYYLAAIEAMDSEIGRLLNTMLTKEKENTLIIYIGDNGTPAAVIDTSVYAKANSKGSLSEGGIRVPMVVSGYNVTRQNEREDALVNTTDFYATLSQFVGGSETQIYDSYSFLSLLSASGNGLRSYNYSEFESDDVTGWTVRSEDYKYISNTTDTTESLFKVSSDIGESNDLSSNSTLSSTKTELANQGKTIRGESTTSPIDITDAVLTKRSGNCADYVESYESTVTDVNRSLGFNGDLTITVSNGKCIFNTNNIPNHNFNDGTQSFPNDVSAQNNTLAVTASPSHASSVTGLTLTTDNAILLNGVKVDLLAAACYGVGDGKVGCNDITQPWRFDPMFAANGFRVDTHNAHSQPDGSYHYHGHPNALFDSEDGTSVSPVIGFAADGYPIFGSYINDNGTIRKAVPSYQLRSGSRPSGDDDPGGTYDGTYRDDYEYVEGSGDLDDCNGMTVDGVYGYYVTDAYPYILACFKGTPDSSFDK